MGANQSENSSGKWGKLALLCAAVAAWNIYDISSATETPRQAVMVLQYFLLACALIGLAGALVKLMSID